MSDSDLGLPARPAPDPAVIAVLGVVLSELSQEQAPVVPTPPDMTWRFSGHWFTKNDVARRSRPR